MGVSKNRRKTPQIIHFNSVFHYFHHPFWGTPIFGNTQMHEIFFWDICPLNFCYIQPLPCCVFFWVSRLTTPSWPEIMTPLSKEEIRARLTWRISTEFLAHEATSQEVQSLLRSWQLRQDKAEVDIWGGRLEGGNEEVHLSPGKSANALWRWKWFEVWAIWFKMMATYKCREGGLVIMEGGEKKNMTVFWQVFSLGFALEFQVS